MLSYQNLRFFNGNSGELDFTYDSENEIWVGAIYLPRVSTGLYETANLFIFEEVVVESGVLEYVRPISENPLTTQFEFVIESSLEDKSEDITLYGVNVSANEYTIDEFKFTNQDFLNANNSLGTVIYNNTNHTQNVSGNSAEFKKVSDHVDKTPVQCNIALKTEVEGIHTNNLNIYEVHNGVATKQIANIYIYGEAESEDERLSVLLHNMGLSINEEDVVIFNESDINEISTDWMLLNNKRKELLLEAHNIAPFIGTYKALLNAIKFYGYDNLTIKEYWLNINEQSTNFGKLVAVPVPGQDVEGFLANKSAKIELPNSNHKKTSRFSLVYRINEATGALDEWDLPIVKETSDFTPEEILIKLYGLKKKLQKEYLPLQAKIVDITAEGDFFSQFTQNVWNNQNTIQIQSSGIEVDFEIYPKRKLFIEDLRLVSDDLATTNLTFPLTPSTNESVVGDIENFYTHYYDQELNTFTTLTPVPIGCPIVLKATSLNDFWQDADYSWNDADIAANDYTSLAQASIYTWDNIWSRDVYEIEWIITGPKNYNKTFRGAVADLYHMALVLPYTGSYDVVLNMYDLYNARSFTVKSSEIIVNNKAVEIYGMYEWKNHKTDWNHQQFTWDYAGGIYDFSQDSPMKIDEMVSTWYMTMDRNNYVYDDTMGISFSTVRRYLDSNTATGFNETPGPYVWKNLKSQVWNDGMNVTWDSTRVGTDLAASFKIDVRQDQGYSNGTLNIVWENPGTQQFITESYTIQSSYPIDANDLTAWQNIADELNALSATTNPIFSKFNWNPVFVDNNFDGIDDSCTYILAVGKEYSSSYNYETANFSTGAGDVSGMIKYTVYNPTWNDTVIFENHATVTLMTHLTFSFDKSNMPGVVTSMWTINNTSNPNFEEIVSYNQWLTYLFAEHGNYEIKLKLIDSNGNENTISRNMLSIVKAEELLLV